MKNKIKVVTDGINVYAYLKVNASKIGIKVLIALLLIEISFLIWASFQIPPKELVTMIIPLIILCVFLVGLPIKYLLWNLYGVEELIVNTKSISWSYNYGFFKTKLKTITYNKLNIDYEKVNGAFKNETGRLLFYDYSKTNPLPKLIHKTTVLLSKSDVQEFDQMIMKVFAQEKPKKKEDFFTFSLN